MSGFCGVDFVLEDGTGRAWMIELNPRATQLGHLAIGPSGTLAAALLARLRGDVAPAAAQPRITQETVAFFPQAWLSGTVSPLLPPAYHDVPWAEPALVAELMRRPWDGRSLLARLTDTLMRRPDSERILAASIAHMRPREPAGESAAHLPTEPAAARATVDVGADSIPASDDVR